MNSQFFVSNQWGATQTDMSDQFTGQESWCKVVAHTKDGYMKYGLCNALDLEAPSFELFLHDKEGKPLNKRSIIPFEYLKALFVVKHFEGHLTGIANPQMEKPPTAPIAIEFADGEIMIGRPTQPDWESASRFSIWPEDTGENNNLVLVVRNAVRSILPLEVFQQKQQKEFNAFVRKYFKPGKSQDECLGDYYFSKHDYSRAMEHYRIALEHDAASGQIRRKLCATKYNIGVRHIKNKNYDRALRYMELVLALDPEHPDAREKVQKLRERLRTQKSLEDVHSNLPACMDSKQLKRFIDCTWVDQHHHFILTGPAGSGKTRLSCAIGHKASRKGLKTIYYRLPRLLDELRESKKNGDEIALVHTLETADFLILDDWNDNLLKNEERRLLRDVITGRYQRRATLFLTECASNEWHRLFGANTASDPIFNKVLHDAHKIHLEPESNKR